MDNQQKETPETLEGMIIKKIARQDWQRKEVKDFPWVFHKDLQSRRDAGQALKKRRDMGWELILNHFKVRGEDQSYSHFLEVGWEETGNVEDVLDWQVDNIDNWAVDYAYLNGLPLYCTVCSQYSIQCKC